MSEKNYGSVVIVDNQNKVIGICTERDILKKLVNQKLNAERTKLEKIMTANPRVGKEDDEVLSWLRTMSNDRFRRLPVVDNQGKLKQYLRKVTLYLTHGQIYCIKLLK